MEIQNKISQYADDTSIFLDGSDNSLNELLKELDFFAAISGLKVNFDKTQLVWIGAKKTLKNLTLALAKQNGNYYGVNKLLNFWVLISIQTLQK